MSIETQIPLPEINETQIPLSMANANGVTVEILHEYFEKGKINSGNKDIDSPSIFMVPSILRDLSPCSFNPQMVSIGPLHKEDEKLQESQGLKESYLHDLFHHVASILHEADKELQEQTVNDLLEACVQKVNDSIDLIRKSYAGMKPTYSNADLGKMVVLDGCFVLEFCHKHYKGYKMHLPNTMYNLCIAIDLILVENQIPFFVLQDLFDCTLKKVTNFSLSKILHTVLALYLHPFNDPLPSHESHPSKTDSSYDHVIGFFHKCYQLKSDAEPLKHADSDPSLIKTKEPTVHSVTELDKAGVNFKPHQEKNWPMKMEFKSYVFGCFPLSWSKHTFLMPTLVIDDYSEPVLRNFIAYEQSLAKVHYNFTSYAYAMDKLIDTHEDVSKLVESKVLVNRLGSNQEAADMINKICKNISLADFSYTHELEKIDTYYNGYWPRNISKFRLTYFNSPWNAIALFAGIILFSLTIVQTVFTIMAS